MQMKQKRKKRQSKQRKMEQDMCDEDRIKMEWNTAQKLACDQPK